VVEYAVLLGVAAAVIFGMQVYAKRSLQAGLKTAADGLSPLGAEGDPDGKKAQRLGAWYESGERRNRSVAAAGMVLDRASAGETQATKTIVETQNADGGRTRQVTQDQTITTGALGGGVSSRSTVVVDED